MMFLAGGVHVATAGAVMAARESSAVAVMVEAMAAVAVAVATAAAI